MLTHVKEKRFKKRKLLLKFYWNYLAPGMIRELQKK